MFYLVRVFAFFGLLSLAYADSASSGNAQHEVVQNFFKRIFSANKDHVETLDKGLYQSFAKKQTPTATVVMCSDSRIQNDAFDKSSVNEFFVIRNIGNQISTATGSVEYGVEHVHTPVLLIIGHSNCGAIKAGRSDYSKESEHIRQELDSLNVKNSASEDDGIFENVHHQVEIALEKFSDRVKKGELTVVGAVYDFRDDFKRGHGRLILIDINGEKDLAKLKESPFLKDIPDVVVGKGG